MGVSIYHMVLAADHMANGARHVVADGNHMPPHKLHGQHSNKQKEQKAAQGACGMKGCVPPGAAVMEFVLDKKMAKV
jgi:hypothetical protein